MSEWYVRAESYGEAARCPTCLHRACLTDEGALRLVARSGERLTSYRCPDDRGWHVWAPGIERSPSALSGH